MSISERSLDGLEKVKNKRRKSMTLDVLIHADFWQKV